MERLKTNDRHAVPVDGGQEYLFSIRGHDIIGVLLDADEPIGCSIDTATGTNEPGGDDWFLDQDTFEDTDTISQNYQALEQWVRVRVTNPAPDGTTADIAIVG